MNAADQLAALLDPDLGYSSALGWGLRHGPVHDLAERLHRLTGEITNMGGRRDVDLPAYVTAMHALILDLVELTGAATNGRRHPAHDELLEDFGLSRGPS